MTKNQHQNEPELTEQMEKIQEKISQLKQLCLEVDANVILSIHIPGQTDSTDSVVQLCAGELIAQVMQLDIMVDNNPDFKQALEMYLSYKIKAQMNTQGSTGSAIADKLLASISKENTREN